ncbi:uncharacterized protein [Lepeophtheirus salmonis]|uniref:uncharacterized protein isoform X4 n=1 Tax=Lepeophtheirus salmonis TaxID=72036 RepID=UPI001AE26EE5|nr:uncharacterized protein LOC121119909 isoform X4 [Lepeophtheirus salmonis]
MKHKVLHLLFKRSLSLYKVQLSGMFILISIGVLSIIQLNVIGWTDGRRLRGGRDERLQKVTLFHEQTVAVIQYRYDQPVECDLILAESRDESIKNNLLESLGMESDVIREIPFQEMTSIIDTCNTLDKVLNPNETTNIIKKDPETKDDEDVEDVYFKSIFSGIVPGTKWCGINDIAVNYHDIGDEGELDRCCRAHDHCPVKVKAFQSNYGTFNFHPYTKSHCYCDNVFYNCLKRLVTGENSTNTPLQKAHTIGNIYFNVIGIECIEPKFPVHCLESMNEEGIVIIHEATSTYRQPNIPLHRFRRSFNFGQSNDGNSNNNERTDKCIKWTVDMSREPKYFQVRPKKRF